MLIYGKLADLIGRKPVYTFGAILFLIGSLLCGYAQSMTPTASFKESALVPDRRFDVDCHRLFPSATPLTATQVAPGFFSQIPLPDDFVQKDGTRRGDI